MRVCGPISFLFGSSNACNFIHLHARIKKIRSLGLI
jgi:hypothetical protein